MSKHCAPNESIEGDKLDGSSRNPLETKGTHLFHNHRCTRYSASFDVEAIISEGLSGAQFLPGSDSDITVGAKIFCRKAVIHTIAKKATHLGVRARTHKHQANFWSLNGHTHAHVEHAHEEILQAIEKRIRDAALAGRSITTSTKAPAQIVLQTKNINETDEHA